MGLAVHPRERDLVIATHGRGVYILDDVRPLSRLTASTLGEPLHLFPIADAQQHWQKIDPGIFGSGAGEFHGENRPYGALVTFSVSGAGIPLTDEQRERDRKERERLAALQAAAQVSSAAPESTRPGGEAARAGAGEPRKPGAKPAEEKKKEEDKKKDEGPKAQIEVADAAGKTIRHFKAPVKLGINRVTWGFERDDFKEPPPGADQPPPQEDPAGPEVPPGTYTVTVKFRGHEAKAAVKVLADPRSPNREADWQQRWAVILHAGALQEAAVEAVERIARIRADVESSVAKAKQASEARRAAERRDGKDVDQGRGRRQGDDDAEASSPLADAAEKLEKGLADLDKRLWNRPDAQGLLAPEDILDQISIAGSAVTGQWDPPSPAQLETLDQLGGRLDGFLADFNRFCAADLAAFRKRVVDAKVGLLPEDPPLAVAKP